MARISRWIVWLLLLAIAVFTLCPIAYRPTTGAPTDVERAVAFALLGAAVFVAYPKRRLIGILLVVVWAAAIEAGQDLVPDRHGRVHDLAVKALAVVVGAVLASAFERLRRSR